MKQLYFWGLQPKSLLVSDFKYLARWWCSIFCGFLLFGLSAKAADPYHAFTTENAYVWDTPGYSWKDCRAMDSSAKYDSDLDRTLTDMRFGQGGQKACQGRQVLLEPGTHVAIIRNDKGEPLTEERDLIFSGNLIKKKFYRVWMRDKKTGKDYRGWIAESQLTRPTPEKEDETVKPEPVSAIDKPDCPPADAKPGSSKASNGTPQVQREVEKLASLTQYPSLGLSRQIDHSKKELSERKSNAEIDRFMCLYRAGSNETEFAALLKKFKKAAAAAEASFGVPYAMTMCFALTESTLKHEGSGEYRGYGQFGSQRIEDLQKALKRDPYKGMWEDYKSRTSSALQFTDDAIRNQDNPTLAAAAIAFAMRQTYGDLFPLGKCTDCSSASAGNPKTAPMNNLNRKDLYLMIGGYNYTPSKISTMALRSTAGLATSHPPPLESRNYMRQMDNCLTKGEEMHFRQASSTAANARRNRDIGRINKVKAQRAASLKKNPKLKVNPKTIEQEDAQIRRYQDLIARNVSQEYEDKESECNRTHPK